jgi:hypothetical protein
MGNYYVIKDRENDIWKFKKQGSDNALLTAEIKDEIMQTMRIFMRNRTGSVKIQKEDGTFQEERTYPSQKDPTSSLG